MMKGQFIRVIRTVRYSEVISELLIMGKAYYCDCSMERLELMREEQIAKKEKPKYDRCCRDKGLKKGVIRFLNPVDGSVNLAITLKVR